MASINYGLAEIRTGHTMLAMLSRQFAGLQEFGEEWKRIDAAQLSSNYLEIVRTSSESSGQSAVPKQAADSTLSTRFFISYRHSDSGHSAGRVSDHLVQAFGQDRVFIDVARLEPGELYEIVLSHAIDQSDVILAIIGKHWNRVSGHRGRALDDEADWVRLELRMAIEKGKRIIPCTVDGAKPPRAEDLPAVLKDLAKRQVMEISQNQFGRDMAGLVDLLKKIQPSKVSDAKAT